MTLQSAAAFAKLRSAEPCRGVAAAARWLPVRPTVPERGSCGCALRDLNVAS